MKKIFTNSNQETIELGEKIIKYLPSDINVILLEGDLSAGKTTLTKGIGKALGIKEIINSPTFTIMKKYKGLRELYHMDLYRMEQVGNDFDLEEYIDNKEAISVIEWPFQVKELLPSSYILIKLEWLEENKRGFEISTHNYSEAWEVNL